MSNFPNQQSLIVTQNLLSLTKTQEYKKEGNDYYEPMEKGLIENSLKNPGN
jgi:hypothetical protein